MAMDAVRRLACIISAPTDSILTKQMSFRSDVLPHIKPLFELSDPPQVIVVLLDTIPLFVEKCTGSTFRDGKLSFFHSFPSSNSCH